MDAQRSVTDVLQDVLRNVQDIIRAEVRLAKVEARHEAGQALSSGAWLAAGMFGAASASGLLLWALVYGLATRLPMWGATLAVAVVVGVVSAVAIRTGLARLKRVTPVPQRTVESVKENVEWIKQQTR
jgi:sorbitol-specific phosphotransferase system component IIBC